MKKLFYVAWATVRASSAYSRCSEQTFLFLFEAIRTVVSCAEIIKYRKYGHITKIESSMLEGDRGRQSAIAKIKIVMRRNEHARELLEKIIKERRIVPSVRIGQPLPSISSHITHKSWVACMVLARAFRVLPSPTSVLLPRG